MRIQNVTPSESPVDSALIGVVEFGQVVEVDDEDGALLIAGGHFAEVGADEPTTDTDTNEPTTDTNEPTTDTKGKR